MFKNVTAFLVLLAALWAGFKRVGPLPPVGQLLDPAHGVWAAAAHTEHPAEATDSISGLGASVQIRYDQRGVPHIFASSETDAFRALGYVVARDRLFQLELQARAGAGTLSELVGAAAVPADQEIRALGLPRAAERNWRQMPNDADGKRYALAYADGVNAWIAQLTPALLPVEYKLLGRTPARWEAINTLHMFSRMAYMLSWFSDDLNRVAAEALIGRAATASVFPLQSTIQEPIQPSAGTPRFDYSPLLPPGAPDSAALALLPSLLPLLSREVDGDARIFASNNWAVAPQRSATGHALLAGDPHLGLTLPSIWFEAHLVVPGALNVYGVTIPGAPGILIGVTPDLAWSFTNTGADVVDFYREIVDDHGDPRRYMLDDAWRDIELREELYRDPTGRVLRRDTVRYTHRGPMRLVEKEWVSTRWTALETTDLTAFVRASRQHSAPAFLDTLAATFTAPAQNAIVADRSGNIAIRSTGHYPIQPDGAGERLRDGTSSANDWQGYWPVSAYPQALNPAQGFLASANQAPLDDPSPQRYLGPSSAFDPWRALHINRLLRARSAVTVDDMRLWQTDPGSARADHFMPWLLAATRKQIQAGTAAPAIRLADSVLRAWDRRYTPDNTGSVLFEAALREVQRATWDEFTLPDGTRRVRPPGTDQLLRLLADSASPWWDARATTNRTEQRDDVVASAVAAAWDSVSSRHGQAGAGWAWRKTGAAVVGHLLGLDGFGRRDLAIQGGPGTLNPSGPSAFGASWRMVVELGDTVRAYGTYPGGQSGNPVSRRYDDRIAAWSNGSLEPLPMPLVPEALAPAQVRAVLTLEKR